MPSSSPPPPPPLSRGGGLSLGAPRGGRGGGRGRLDGSASGSSSPRPLMSAAAAQRADAAVRATDNDAMGSRLSAILQRYLPNDDIYTPILASSDATTSATLVRRAPIINIGTYLRCRAIDMLVAHFLAANEKRPTQIISLGAGSDSRFWRLHSDKQTSESLVHYVELDFAELTKAKIERIIRRKELARVVVGADEEPEISSDGTNLQTNKYSLVACDLRTLPNDTAAQARLIRHLDPSVDTLIVAECVLAYLSPDESNALLRYLGGALRRPCAVCYEMCVAGDMEGVLQADVSRFGAVMLSNLEARSLWMPGSRAFATVASHAQRFRSTLDGSQHSAAKGTARTLKQVWADLDDSERQRLSRLEGLDEVEELEILLAHYALSWYAYDAPTYAGFLNPSL